MTREEAISILNFERGYFCDLKGCQEQQAYTMAIRALEQEPKIGHWINGNYHIECSECGEEYPYQLRNYCPNCGARMVEPQESEI